ncbi:universal stress protein [Primorskyibacter aestuariivivens]|uniref:universal stress protein n=1 Tax=Primorskyibacter aestuariivivens TaxID=1888912 RepID=UPI0023019261|nr:universal stress protein [Primorskyibacter aestuariivivens]MDA7427787.1 universal stress protein [Primorskyibacter aestuariivivens]
MYKNLLIPVVLDDAHDTQASFLAAKALADDGAEFTVMHVVEEMPAYVASQIPADLAASTRAEIERRLASLAKGLPGAKPKLVHGHAGRTIVDYATDNKVDCIIVASHIPGLQDYFLGSTADRVVRHARCAVHVIR